VEQYQIRANIGGLHASGVGGYQPDLWRWALFARRSARSAGDALPDDDDRAGLSGAAVSASLSGAAVSASLSGAATSAGLSGAATSAGLPGASASACLSGAATSAGGGDSNRGAAETPAGSGRQSPPAIAIAAGYAATANQGNGGAATRSATRTG